MTMAPFIWSGEWFLKSLANFPVMKFPRMFLQTFHFLEHATCFPEKKGVSLEDPAWWLSLCIGSWYSVGRLPGTPKLPLEAGSAPSRGNKSAFDIKISSLGDWLGVAASKHLSAEDLGCSARTLGCSGCHGIGGLLGDGETESRGAHCVASHGLGPGQGFPELKFQGPAGPSPGKCPRKLQSLRTCQGEGSGTRYFLGENGNVFCSKK